MTVSFAKKTDLNHRIDHEIFEDVARVHYMEGTIKDFGVSQTSLLTLDDTCTVEVLGGSYSKVPIFYHCREGFYDNTVRLRRETGALTHAAWGFKAGQKVKVAFDGAKPLAVFDHNTPQVYGDDPKGPYKCLDIFRLQWHRSIGSGRAPYQPPDLPVTEDWLNWFMFQKDWHTLHYRCTTQEEYCDKNDPPVEPDGHVAELPHRSRHIFGMREQQFGTMVYYLGDWMVVVGPVAYFMMVYAIGMPAPITGTVTVYAGVWTPERHELWMENARRKEEKYGEKDTHSAQLSMDLLTGYPYVNTYYQPKFTKTFMDRFRMTGAGESPKWILSEFWTYDWDRQATDPNTPNTPDG
jgi:hypothetical protein